MDKVARELTSWWAWPMWLGLGIWRVSEKARWEQVVRPVAQRWLQGWEPSAAEAGAFLATGLFEELRRWQHWTDREKRQLAERRRRARLLPWPDYRERVCRTMHQCCLCEATISLGQRYADGGYGRRAHVECWRVLPEYDRVAVDQGRRG